MKYGFYTDPHMMGINPMNRIDDYPKTIVKKCNEVYDICSDEKVDAILCGGDLFNSHKVYSYELISSFVDVLKKHKIKTYFIIGQHDLYGYNKESYDTSVLKFASNMGDGLFECVVDKLELGDTIIHACHVFDDIVDKISAVEKSDKFQIMIAHCLLNDKVKVYDVIKTDSLPSSNLDLILSGDLHTGYKFHKIGRTHFYNPGSLSRTKCSRENVRDIKFAIFDTNDIANLKEYVLKTALPMDVVFNKEALLKMDEIKDKLEKNANIDNFVKMVNDFEVDAVDIYDLIDLVGKQSNESDELINYILRFKEKKNG